MRALHGFASLRTRPIEPLVPTVSRRRCTVCGAVLRSSNPSGTCATPLCPKCAQRLRGAHNADCREGRCVKLIAGHRVCFRAKEKAAREAALT